MKLKHYQTQYKPFSVRRMERKHKQRIIVTLALVAVFVVFFVSWFIPKFIGSLLIINNFKNETKPIVVTTDAIAPPSLNIPFEATQSATIEISGDARASKQVEIYIDNSLKAVVTTKEDGSFKSEPIALNLGNNYISAKAVGENNLKSLSSKPIRVFFTNEKPKLEIQTPSDNQIISGGDKKITVTGQTNAQNDMVVTVSGERVIVNQEGKFSRTISIKEGENEITIIATDVAGNSTEVRKKVTYQTESTPTPSPTNAVQPNR